MTTHCEPYVNPDWGAPTLNLKRAYELLGAHYPAAIWDAWDSFYKSAIKLPYDYVVVSGAPSADLDELGRKEINAGSVITDTRLYGFKAYYIIVGAGRNTINRQYIIQTDDHTLRTTTLEIKSGDSWSEGDIISVVYG